ncbi:MAG TPA: hypothetical protein VLX92_00230 [Kofleriaceae bacterium]|nr:hypothetical protein [Kofleriaceae bacterium]
MSRRRCRFASELIGLVVLGGATDAAAQACCAGSNVVTPARLELHDDALVGIEARATDAYGSFDPTGTFVATPPGASELDLEQDVFGALRVLPRGQVAVLVPLIETRRTVPGDKELGGGLGDLNLSARYDFIYASEARYVPGISLLVGVTFPTGTPPESASMPLATDATGVGAYQANLGISIEKAIGPWLVGATGLVAKRAQRTADGVTESLAAQWTALAVAAYTLRSGVAVALSGSFTAEGTATIDGMDEPGSRRRLVAISASGVMPLSDQLRLQGAITFDPPLSSMGINQPAAGVGLAATVVYAWQ